MRKVSLFEWIECEAATPAQEIFSGSFESTSYIVGIANVEN